MNGSDLHAPEEVFAYARDLEALGDHRRAATEYGRYVSAAKRTPEQEFPRLEEGMYRLAMNLAQAKETDAALRAFADLGAVFPRSRYIPRALFRMGQIYEQEGAVGEAKQRYHHLVAMGMDTELSALSRLRLAWLALGKPGEEALARQHLQGVKHPRYAEQAKGMLHEVDALPDLPYKDPWVAGSMTAVLPGAGHLYLDRPKDAGLALLSNALLITGSVQAFSKGISGLGALLAVLEAGWYSGTVFSAVSLAHKHNQRLRDDRVNGMGMFLKPDVKAVGVEMEWQY
ncbi:MAG: tetratricopeptide repeat protein [Magnetococcus sp. YQC-5]